MGLAYTDLVRLVCLSTRVPGVAQVFTDLMLLLLQQEGKVAVSDLVTKYAPAYQPKDIWESTSRGATLKDLGSHMCVPAVRPALCWCPDVRGMCGVYTPRAGLPRYSPCPFYSCNETLETIVERLSTWTLLQSPGVR